MMLRAVIVDDEPHARTRVSALLAQEPDVEVVEECSNGIEAVDAIREHRPDLVFLDVQMPGMNGLEVVAAVGIASMPAVVFVTAYDEFAVRAFEANALDYLLKPYDTERFRAALGRARLAIERRRSEGVEGKLDLLLRSVGRGSPYAERLVTRTGSRLQFIPVAEIEWIEADGNYVRVHAGARPHLIRETLGSMEAKLDPERFVRIHRSLIANISCIREMESVLQGEYVVVLSSGKKLSSSRTYRERLEAAMGLRD